MQLQINYRVRYMFKTTSKALCWVIWSYMSQEVAKLLERNYHTESLWKCHTVRGENMITVPHQVFFLDCARVAILCLPHYWGIQGAANIRRQMLRKLKCLFTVYRLLFSESLHGCFHCKVQLPVHKVVDSKAWEKCFTARAHWRVCRWSYFLTVHCKQTPWPCKHELHQSSKLICHGLFLTSGHSKHTFLQLSNSFHFVIKISFDTP